MHHSFMPHEFSVMNYEMNTEKGSGKFLATDPHSYVKVLCHKMCKANASLNSKEHFKNNGTFQAK